MEAGEAKGGGMLLDLWDYRRRVSDLYARVRAMGVGEQAWLLWRRTRDELFRDHPLSALPAEARQGFRGLDYFDYDPGWHLEGEVVREAETPQAVADSVGGETAFRRVGRVRFRRGEGTLELDLLWLESYGGGAFLAFSDATSGRETYGGGRYLLDTAKGADLGHEGDRVVLDFNFAYHPSCVYDPVWSCPLAPAANRLPVEVGVGERLAL